MRKFLSILTVAALVATTAQAGVFGFMSSKKQVAPKAQPKTPSKGASRVTPEDKKIAEEEGYDVGKIAQRLKNGSK